MKATPTKTKNKAKKATVYISFMECAHFLSDFFVKWCHENELVAGHISMSTDPEGLSARKRAAAHKRVCNELAKFREKVNDLVAKTEKELKHVSALPFPAVPRLAFEQQEQNMNVRKLVFLEIEILQLSTSCTKKRLVFLQDLARCVSNAIDLFTGEVIPSDLCLNVEPSFYVIDLDEVARDEDEKVERMNALKQAMINEIRGYELPTWVRDYPKFLNDLIDEMVPRVDRVCSYVAPNEKEISLSRCLFNARSMYAWKIDDMICKNLRKEKFVDALINLCYELIPERETMPADRQSVALIVLFRAVFNRVYEKFPTVFWREPDADLQKVWRLASMPLSSLSFPIELLSRRWDGEASIEAVFRHEPLFHPASMFLFLAIFESNPIDALFAVHRSLLCIKKGAWINSRKDSGVPVSIEEVNNCLCFDDFFSLLIGVVIGSDVPDVFYLSWFVTTHIPRDKVSPAFSFALANLEGLTGHFHGLE